VWGLCLFVYKSYISLYVFQNLEKNPPKQESLVFLRNDCAMLEKAEKQRKTREKSKIIENQVFRLDFCAKKGL
jgi:hypothetical protein